MAELSERPTPERAVDARAVRARLASPVHPGKEDHLRLAPVAPPLRMSNPSVGVGPLGGALLPPVHVDEAGVLAQRHVLVDGEPEEISLEARGHDRYVLREDGVAHRVVLEPAQRDAGGALVREVLVDGFRLEVEVTSERRSSLRERASRGRAAAGATGPLAIKAIIPGKVASVSVEVGDTVSAGQQLLVVEAMKMQNELRAPRDGTIERVGVAPGVNIEVGDLLVVIS
ncbi:MAG TPA: biotin/lipoyl-containing protein [Candidatus Limnocylindrales bacterium]|nr:biotin/lipoyl-containing protein [Candidatus Limnocylindrales bacterium]